MRLSTASESTYFSSYRHRQFRAKSSRGRVPLFREKPCKALTIPVLSYSSTHRCKSVSLSKMKNSPGQETLSQQSVPTPLNVVHCASEKEASKSEAKTQPTSAMAGGTSVASNMDRPPWM